MLYNILYSSGNLTVGGAISAASRSTINGLNVGYTNTSYGLSATSVRTSGDSYTGGINQSNGGYVVYQSTGAGIGISLYYTSSANNPAYGLMFAQTSSYGTHGTVTGNWATYFTMSADSGRGWIFRSGSNSHAASISNYGDIYAKRNMVAYGEVTAYSTSDIRLKKNIINITTDEAINILSKIRPVTYEWNDKAFELNSHQRYKGRETGLIAQEVISILPCAIKTVFEEYMSIDYTRLIPPIIAVVNEHELEIQRLKAEIKQLKERLSA